MKKIVLLFFILISFVMPSEASFADRFFVFFYNDEKAVKKVLESQVKYANKTNYEKFINTYDSTYRNADGFNLEMYSNLIKDIWKMYDDIKYDIDIKSIVINGDKAIVKLNEMSYAEIPVSKVYCGELRSEADSVYYLKKIDGVWKVVYDEVLNETTTMLYGDARDLKINLIVPENVGAGDDYTVMLEFTPPAETFAIASIASEKIEYPQKQAKEVFRILPGDNVLERIFTFNTDNVGEYVVASIGLTKTEVKDASLKLSLTGFGYTIKRINVKKGFEEGKGAL